MRPKFVDMLEEDIIITNIPKKKMIFRKKKKKKHLTRKLDVGYVTKNSLTMLKIARLGTIVILPADIEELLIKNVISCIENLILRPLVFHNLIGYGSHLFVKNLGRSEWSINCIPNNEEKYISFAKKIQVGSYTKKIKNKGETKEETKP